jgi:transcription initiation factor TFIIIB Brf1 subunit/transcription initiation factor TFIIB
MTPLERRLLSGEPFTYGEMCAYARRLGLDEEHHRAVDKTIQRFRKRGWISFVRVGRSPLWTATAVGIEAGRES